MRIISTEPAGPPKGGLVFMVVVLSAAVLGLLLVAGCQFGNPPNAPAHHAPKLTKQQKHDLICGQTQTWAQDGGVDKIKTLISDGLQLAYSLGGHGVIDVPTAADQMERDAVVGRPLPADPSSWRKFVLGFRKAAESARTGDFIAADRHVVAADQAVTRVAAALKNCNA